MLLRLRLTGGRRATVGALVAVVAGVLPIHLTGALAPDLQDELGFGDAELGIGVALAFAFSALLTGAGGAFTDSAGPRRALRIAACFSAAGLVVLASAPMYGVLVLGLVLSTPGNAIAQPGGNVLIAEGVGPARRGMALGIKQSAIAVSTALSGIASLVLADTLGWRWAYGAAVCVAGVAVLMVPEVRVRARVPGASETSSGGPGVLDASSEPAAGARTSTDAAAIRAAALTGLAGAAAVASIGTFLVRAAQDAGLATSTGRLVLTGGSVLLIAMRIGWGALADSGRIDANRTVVRLLLAGTVGYLLLSTGTLGGFIVGAALAFGAGWSWPGLLFLVLVRRFPHAAGRPSGQVQRGMFIGAMVGPFLFGVVADSVSFTAAWWMSAGWGLLAAVAARGVVRHDR
ncbi:MAG: MFS transporter [Acidimicrobiia bacterium]|nr:MFS transporter [Acidimicrobiia bacterium]